MKQKKQEVLGSTHIWWVNFSYILNILLYIYFIYV